MVRACQGRSGHATALALGLPVLTALAAACGGAPAAKSPGGDATPSADPAAATTAPADEAREVPPRGPGEDGSGAVTVDSTTRGGATGFASTQEAESALASAEVALGRALGDPGGEAQAEDADAAKEKKAEALAQRTGCPPACAALASMRRAAAAICSLAGDDDGRCSAARTRVEAGAERAAACRCAAP